MPSMVPCDRRAGPAHSEPVQAPVTTQACAARAAAGRADSGAPASRTPRARAAAPRQSAPPPRMRGLYKQGCRRGAAPRSLRPSAACCWVGRPRANRLRRRWRRPARPRLPGACRPCWAPWRPERPRQHGPSCRAWLGGRPAESKLSTDGRRVPSCRPRSVCSMLAGRNEVVEGHANRVRCHGQHIPPQELPCGRRWAWCGTPPPTLAAASSAFEQRLAGRACVAAASPPAAASPAASAAAWRGAPSSAHAASAGPSASSRAPSAPSPAGRPPLVALGVAAASRDAAEPASAAGAAAAAAPCAPSAGEGAQRVQRKTGAAAAAAPTHAACCQVWHRSHSSMRSPSSAAAPHGHATTQPSLMSDSSHACAAPAMVGRGGLHAARGLPRGMTHTSGRPVCV